jgi:hypothetical protein
VRMIVPWPRTVANARSTRLRTLSARAHTRATVRSEVQGQLAIHE